MDRLNVQDFLELYIKRIVKYPELVSTSIDKGDKSDYTISISVSSADVGKVIGKEGKMIGALKNVVSAYKAKDKISYELIVHAIDTNKTS